MHSVLIISGKSLVCKEKCIQTTEKERNAKEQGLKRKADPVFFISMVGVDIFGIVDKYEHLFDIYTRAYDLVESDVHVITAQDLWNFYKRKHWYKWNKRRNVDIYELVEFFIRHHPNGHFVLDECPFLRSKCYEMTFQISQ